MYKFFVFMLIYSWFWLLIVVDVIRIGNLVCILWECFKFGLVIKILDFRLIIRFLKLLKYVVLEYVWLIWILLIFFDEMEVVFNGNIVNLLVEIVIIWLE